MHILVVEDDPQISAHIKRVLEDALFTVTCVSNGEDAVSKIEFSEYDLILLDLLLPKMNGIEVCTLVRKKNKKTPIIMLTSQADIESRVSGLDAGADDYLCKPFSFEELIARVRALLRRGGDRDSTILSTGHLTLDPAKYEVHYKKKEVLLTNHEYQILEYFMRNPNQVCTKLMIEEHVWGSRYDQESNIIEVTISRLRKKMKDVGAGETIKTRHGLGYTIETSKK